MRTTAAILAVLLASTAANAWPKAPTDIQVELGPAVVARTRDLGRSELQEQAQYLMTGVRRLLARRDDAPAYVHLVIADIEPTQPTSAQLGTSPQLRQSSFGLGGAAITGEVGFSDGRRLPVRYRFFQDQVRDEVNFTTWGDADQAFDELAAQIASGHVPDDPDTWPRPHRTRVLTGTRIPG